MKRSATLDSLDMDIGLDSSIDIPLTDEEERASRPIESAAWAALGPPGCGKTALLVYFAHWYHKQGIPVFSNLRSTHSWAQPLDTFHHLLEMETCPSQIVMLLSEAQNYADARRAMSHLNLAAAHRFEQIRKFRSIILYDTQFWNQVDSRLRPLTQRAFVCWTPDYAKHVGAVVYELAVGHLPPWIRAQMRGQMRMYNTSGIRNLYDSHEHIVVEDQNQGNVATAQGITSAKPFIQAAIKRIAGRGVQQVTAADIQHDLEEYGNMVLATAGIAQHMRKLGIPRSIEPLDGRNKFVYHLTELPEDGK